MRLYLVRHGDALTAEEDPDRALSELGRGQARRLAAFLSGLGLPAMRLYHSGKPRARQTAEILADALGPQTSVEAASGLDPNNPVGPLVARIETWRDDSMIVGHLPQLARLALTLLAERDEPAGLSFEPAATACLERDDEGRWSLLWFLGPSLLPPP